MRHCRKISSRLPRRLSIAAVPLRERYEGPTGPERCRTLNFRSDLSPKERNATEGRPATLVSIGSHGFSVLELRGEGQEVFRENSRCAQGTGNFLRQLVERFDLDVEQAARLAAPVEQAAPLSGRCPVILKTD